MTLPRGRPFYDRVPIAGDRRDYTGQELVDIYGDRPLTDPNRPGPEIPEGAQTPPEVNEMIALNDQIEATKSEIRFIENDLITEKNQNLRNVLKRQLKILKEKVAALETPANKLALQQAQERLRGGPSAPRAATTEIGRSRPTTETRAAVARQSITTPADRAGPSSARPIRDYNAPDPGLKFDAQGYPIIDSTPAAKPTGFIPKQLAIEIRSLGQEIDRLKIQLRTAPMAEQASIKKKIFNLETELYRKNIQVGNFRRGLDINRGISKSLNDQPPRGNNPVNDSLNASQSTRQIQQREPTAHAATTASTA